jgi:DNA-binding NtrC family response regulator
MIRVLLYSKDCKLSPLLAPALGSGFEVTSESDPGRTKELVFQAKCDVLLFDLTTLDTSLEDQIRFCEEMQETDVAVIVLADDAARSAAIELVQRGAHSYCRKPLALRELKPMLRRASEHISMKRELDGKWRDQASAILPSCDQLIGHSDRMERVYELIRKVASLNASVLITGESGTGKELIAQAIHNLGDRAKQPFVAVSCGAIPETLIESELFGHEKGAFTGTTGTRIGYFEQAGGGTLFLDEIGELSPQTQIKLLRVLQQREFTRLGSSRPIPLKARVIFATHRNLKSMVEENKFRLDLYYRINVMTIEAPALADRPEDIPLLANHFLQKYSELYCKRVTTVSAEAIELLEQYDWPGNVRELENTIQGAIIRANGTIIKPEDLPEALRANESNLDYDGPSIGTFETLLREYKVKIALKAIQDCNGNKSLAARSLDISRAYLHRLIRSTEVQSISVA